MEIFKKKFFVEIRESEFESEIFYKSRSYAKNNFFETYLLYCKKSRKKLFVLQKLFSEEFFRRIFNPIEMPSDMKKNSDRHNVSAVSVNRAENKSVFLSAGHDVKIQKNSRDDTN